MSGCKTFFLIFYGVVAFLGLLLLGKGEDLPIMLFGLLLLAFGLLLGFRTIGRHFDAAREH